MSDDAKARKRVAEKRWREANKDKCRENSKRWREKNKDKTRERNAKSKLKYGKAYYAEQMREWRKANPDSVKNTELKKRFGITLREYNVMLAAQGGVCAVCGQICTRALSVDHCHETGQIRGLLCAGCNTALGLLGEDVVRMKSLIAYVHKWQPIVLPELPPCK